MEYLFLVWIRMESSLNFFFYFARWNSAPLEETSWKRTQTFLSLTCYSLKTNLMEGKAPAREREGGKALDKGWRNIIVLLFARFDYSGTNEWNLTLTNAFVDYLWFVSFNYVFNERNWLFAVPILVLLNYHNCIKSCCIVSCFHVWCNLEKTYFHLKEEKNVQCKKVNHFFNFYWIFP